MLKWTARSTESYSLLLAVTLAFVSQALVASPSIGAATSASPACPGPALCGKTCSLDAFGTPIYCSNGQCVCPPGYDTDPGPPIVCQPKQPEFTPPGPNCSGSCTSMPWAIVGGISNAFDVVAVHGTSPGGEAFMPVWGYQANFCGVHGVAATDADGNPIRSWAGCTPDPCPFCSGIQDSDEDDWNPPNCDISEGCGGGGGEEECGVHELPFCASDFTSARPYLDKNAICNLPFIIKGFNDPARIDFVNNVSVYRAPIVWENHSDEDDDYTLNQHSPGGELYDTQNGPRVHVEFNASESIDHFTEKNTAIGSFGAANQWWTQLRDTVDNSPGSDDQKDINVRCFMQKFVNPSLTTQICDQLPLSSPGIEPTCPGRPNGKCKDPMAVVVGVPSVDCADHPKENTAEIHPAYAVAIRIQEDPTLPEQWAFFYRTSGNNGGCGSKTYGRCGTTFQLPLGLPGVPAGKVLKSADVHVDAHSWAVDDSSHSGITVDGHFDLANGTLLTVTLPDSIQEGVVGLVTITPVVDTTPPTIICPGNITVPPDLGKCTAAVTFTPTISDDCSVSSVCSPPSGTAFPLGTTTDTCTATDQAKLSASCSFTVTVAAGNKCPQGHGYWKNHTNLWAVNSLTLGSVTYTKAQLISILDGPTKGDASVILARQLITALLNLANGSNPVSVCNTIADANSALDGCTLPCGISPSSAKGQAMITIANNLEMFNSGQLTKSCTK